MLVGFLSFVSPKPLYRKFKISKVAYFKQALCISCKKIAHRASGTQEISSSLSFAWEI